MEQVNLNGNEILTAISKMHVDLVVSLLFELCLCYFSYVSVISVMQSMLWIGVAAEIVLMVISWNLVPTARKAGLIGKKHLER